MSNQSLSRQIYHYSNTPIKADVIIAPIDGIISPYTMQQTAGGYIVIASLESTTEPTLAHIYPYSDDYFYCYHWQERGAVLYDHWRSICVLCDGERVTCQADRISICIVCPLARTSHGSRGVLLSPIQVSRALVHTACLSLT